MRIRPKSARPSRVKNSAPLTNAWNDDGYYNEVNIDGIIANIDSEIARLQQARTLIAAFDAPAIKRRGRPKNVSAVNLPSDAKKRKPLSAEARARIAAAQKRRWAASKKSAN